MDDKKEKFKEFIRNNKDLSKLVIEGKSTYQKLYETYDIYGEDKTIWNNILNNNESFARKAIDYLKKIDTDKLEENFNNIEKALGFLEEIIVYKNDRDEKNNKVGKEENLERIFDD